MIRTKEELKSYFETGDVPTEENFGDFIDSVFTMMEGDAVFAGIATPTTNPGTPDQNVFYIATQSGTYSNFNNIIVYEREVVVITNKSGSWRKDKTGFASYESVENLLYFIEANNAASAYEKGLLSLNIDPNEMPNITYLAMWCYGSNLGPSLYLQYSISDGEKKYLINGRLFDSINNFEPINIVFEGRIIGQVTFYDKSKFVDNPRGTPALLNIRKVLTTEKLANGSVTTEKLANDAIVPKFFLPVKQSEEAAQLSYEQGLYDVYIDKTKFPDITALDMWNYQGRLYVRYKTNGDWVYFINSRYFNTIENGVAINFIKDDVIVGYVIFKDKSKFIDYSRTSGLELNLSVLTSNVLHNGFVIPGASDPSGNAEIIDISLPDKIYAIVGDTLQLFYRGIIKSVNPYKYNILITCSKGKQFPRYYEYTPKIEDVGETSFTFTIKDDNRNVLAQKSCILVTKDVESSPATNINVACFGDSLTAAGTWCAEAKRRLTGIGGTPTGKELTNIAFVGSKNNGDTGYFGVGGWTWRNYVTKGSPAYRFQVSNVTSLSVGATYSNNGNTFTIMEINVTEGSGNILCSVPTLLPTPTTSGVLMKESGNGDNEINYTSVSEDSQNPLWDYSANKMTFIPYANQYAGGTIDVVYTLLTWNGQTPGREDFTGIIEQIEIFANTLHSEFPNAKLKILGIQIPSIRGGMGASYGATGTSYADGYGMVITALNLNKAYQDFANREEYVDFVEFVNVSSQFDTEYNMPHIEKAVNTRNSVTEWQDTNGVHPSNAGYLQIGDIVYRNFIANFCQ